VKIINEPNCLFLKEMIRIQSFCNSLTTGRIFREKRTTFDIPLDYYGTDFQMNVWNALLTIPYGATKTYGDIARLLGDIKTVRAVGGALNKNPISIIVPCHRVVGTSGSWWFCWGLRNKSLLLDLESSLRTPTFLV
jgi:methylated-DNA-[protein]-cysteine S-methyltransferase